jgi:hypothetical protein
MMNILQHEREMNKTSGNILGSNKKNVKREQTYSTNLMNNCKAQNFEIYHFSYY